MRGYLGASLFAFAMIAAPAAASAQDESYPLCVRGQTDHCQNPGEGGAPGHSRASDTHGGPAAYGGGDDMGMHRTMHHRHMKMRHKMRHHRHHN